MNSFKSLLVLALGLVSSSSYSQYYGGYQYGGGSQDATYANTKRIYQDADYIVYRTPMYRMNSKKEALLKQRVLTSFRMFLEKNMKDAKKDLVAGTIEELQKIKEFQQKTSQFADALQKVILSSDDLDKQSSGIDLTRVSGFVVTLGTELSKLLFVERPISASFTITLVPVQYLYIHKRTGKAFVRNKIETSLGLLSLVNLRKLEEKNPTPFKMGVGAIWGPLDRAGDFAGVTSTFSYTTTVHSLISMFKIATAGKLATSLKQTKIDFSAGVLAQMNASGNPLKDRINAFSMISFNKTKVATEKPSLKVGFAMTSSSAARLIQRTVFPETMEDGYYLGGGTPFDPIIDNPTDDPFNGTPILPGDGTDSGDIIDLDIPNL